LKMKEERTIGGVLNIEKDRVGLREIEIKD
jgi:hypothetical protein